MTKAEREKKAREKKEKEAKALAKQELVEFDDGSGDGFEEVDKDAYAIPFIRILQSNSAQVNEDEDGYIEDAKPGMFFNTVSSQLYGKSIRIIPVHYSRAFLEWQPDRGGFVADHKNNLAMFNQSVREGNLNVLPNGNIIVDTRNHFIVVVGKSASDVGIMALTSTNVKHSKKWMSNMKALKLPNGNPAPMFSSFYMVNSVLNKNDQGSWYGIGDKQVTSINREGWITKDFLKLVTEFRSMVISNKVDIDYGQSEDSGNDYSEDEAPF